MKGKRRFIISCTILLIGTFIFSFAGFQNILRSDYKKLSEDDVRTMLKKKGLFGGGYTPVKTFRNRFRLASIGEKQNAIIDDATKLMWHQSGSEECLDYEDVVTWIDDLNKKKFGGFTDWRLPTLEEAASLIESRPIDNELIHEGRPINYPLHINPVFSAYHEFIWTGDGYGYDSEPGHTWFVNFDGGLIGDSEVGAWFVKPVRTIDEK